MTPLLSPAELAIYVRMRCIEDDGCLLWQGAMSNRNRPVFRLACCGTRDPRVVLWTDDGRVLIDGYVFAPPHCDDRCIAPAHQRYMTRRQAVQAAARAGRLSSGARHSAAIRTAMRTRPHVVLDEAKVAALRARYAETGNAAQVAREFGIDHTHAHRIVHNKAWRVATPFSGLGR
jgi:hypothetical protein